MKRYVISASSMLNYLLGNHLGSTSLVTSDTGALITETRYKAWGEVRYSTPNTTLPMLYTFTGQRSYVSDDATDLGAAGFGLMFYNARWCDRLWMVSCGSRSRLRIRRLRHLVAKGWLICQAREKRAVCLRISSG